MKYWLQTCLMRSDLKPCMDGLYKASCCTRVPTSRTHTCPALEAVEASNHAHWRQCFYSEHPSLSSISVSFKLTTRKSAVSATSRVITKPVMSTTSLAQWRLSPTEVRMHLWPLFRYSQASDVSDRFWSPEDARLKHDPPRLRNICSLTQTQGL